MAGQACPEMESQWSSRSGTLRAVERGPAPPPVDISLGALAPFPSVSLEVGQEQPGLTKVFSGRLVTVVPDRLGGRSGPQLPQHMPGGEALQDLAVVGVLDALHATGQRLLQEKQVPIHRRQYPAADEQIADVDDATPGLQGAQPVVGEWDLAQGEGAQDRRDVRFGEPQDAAAGSAHRAHGVEERNQLGANGAGAVVEYHCEPVGEDTSSADPGVVEPALDATPGAGEVAEPAGAGGAQRLAVLADTGDQPLYCAARTAAIGLTRPREAARA